VERKDLMRRACEIAVQLAKLPPLTASYARVAMTQKLPRIIDESVGYGLARAGAHFRLGRRAPSDAPIGTRPSAHPRTRLWRVLPEDWRLLRVVRRAVALGMSP
jgi:hypothetical protein